MNLEDWYRTTERPEERELRRRLRVEAASEIIGGVLLGLLLVTLAWLYLVATPPQSSAINDLDTSGGADVSGRNAASQDGEAR